MNQAENRRKWVEQYGQHPNVQKWLRENPPPADWEGPREAYAYAEMPILLLGVPPPMREQLGTCVAWGSPHTQGYHDFPPCLNWKPDTNEKQLLDTLSACAMQQPASYLKEFTGNLRDANPYAYERWQEAFRRG